MPDQTPQLRKGCSYSRGWGESFEALHTGQIDAVEDHLELAGGQFQARGVRWCGGEVVASGFQPLAP